MSQDAKKAAVAQAALNYVDDHTVVGVGTGSTVNFFIDALAASGHIIAGAVSSSEASTARLLGHDIPVIDLDAAGSFSLYVDGADEADHRLCLIKGGGGALTREKIVAEAAQNFVCVVDDSKQVSVLGRFPLPVEIVPMARALVSAKLRDLGGDARLRDGFITDNGNQILDVHGLEIAEPEEFEAALNQIPGVVTVGLFARRRADILLVAGDSDIKTIRR